jgi:quercetin dioxygenase-like cupin family protein/catechol 2,3-dioxygenase-like lactoylglutathione lyase family enzyme
MSLVGIDHVQIAMPAGGEERARRFYSGLLGLPEVAKPPALAARGGAWFESERLKVHLGVDPEFRPALKAHPGILVEGLEERVAALRAAGHAVVGAEPLQGFDHVYVDDPFGNRIELLERREASAPAYQVERRAEHATRPGFRIRELQLSPTQEVPWHLHSRIRDTFYVLQGSLRIFLNRPSAEVVLGSGETFAVEPGRPHRVTNDGPGSVVFLVLQGLGEYDYVPLGEEE